MDFHHRVRNGYLEQAQTDRNGSWFIIDATGNANNVLLDALVAIFKLLSKKTNEEREFA